MMKKWEYAAFEEPEEGLSVDFLNVLGNQGWELIESKDASVKYVGKNEGKEYNY